MKLNITEKNKNVFFKRDEVTGVIGFDKHIPSRKELRETLASSLQTTPELVSIRKIDNVFGDRKSLFSAFVYADKKSLEQIEPAHYRKRNSAGKEEKGAEGTEESAEKEKAPEQKKVAEQQKATEQKATEKEAATDKTEKADKQATDKKTEEAKKESAK